MILHYYLIDIKGIHFPCLFHQFDNHLVVNVKPFVQNGYAGNKVAANARK